MVLFLAGAYLLSIVPFKIPTVGSKTLLAAAFYMAGYSYNRFPFSRSSLWLVALVCLATVVGVSFFFYGSMDCKGTDIFIYFAVALVGTVGMVHLAGKVKGRCSKRWTMRVRRPSTSSRSTSSRSSWSVC